MTERRIAAAMLATALILGGAAPAHAGVEPQLRRGRDAYFAGRFDEALVLFDAAAEHAAATVAERIEAYKYQAYILFVLKQPNEAEQVWLRLLRLDPSYRVDPIEAAPEMVTFFTKINPPPTEVSPPPPPPPRPIEVIEPPPPDRRVPAAPPEVPRGCGTVGCVLPFGIGQFLNHRPIKGVLFATGEVGFLAANIAMYWSLRVEFDRYGSYQNEASADRRFIMQHVFLGLFAATVIGGIVDAFLFP